MGNVVLDFKPRESLTEFTKGGGKVSLIRRIKGKKSSKNMAIYGENLASLAALKAGSGTSGSPMSVDIIYIDPPYNVGGNQGYNNTWKGKSEKERDWAGDHGAFLDFMEPRLKIGRSLLTEEGIIFVSICDGEYCRLKILMDQIFGASNCLGTIVWNKAQGSSAKHLTAIHEYVLVYAKNAKVAPALQKEKPAAQVMMQKASQLLKENKYEQAQKLYKEWVRDMKKAGQLTGGEAQYNLIHPKSKRIFRVDNTCAHDDPHGKRCRKKLTHPKTGKKCPVPKNGWKWKEETLDRLVKEGRIWFGKDHTTIPTIIKYLDEQLVAAPPTVINMSSNGKNDLPEGVEFTTPKPVKLIQELISIYPKKDAVILDYFAGSGATAHGVHEQNKADGGERSWIMIEEMGSTFHKVMLPRLKYFNDSEEFGIYETDTATVGDKQLLKVFQKYSMDPVFRRGTQVVERSKE